MLASPSFGRKTFANLHTSLCCSFPFYESEVNIPVDYVLHFDLSTNLLHIFLSNVDRMWIVDYVYWSINECSHEQSLIIIVGGGLIRMLISDVEIALSCRFQCLAVAAVSAGIHFEEVLL